MRALFAVPLGADFWKLWTSSAVSNLGDGVTMVAGPLLVTSITTNPAAVAGAVFAQQLPWLLFALISGAWADRRGRPARHARGSRLFTRFNSAMLLQCGLLVEVALHATLALTTSRWVAALMMVVFGIYTSVWGVVVTTIRQRDVPESMYGRVTSVYAVTDLTGAALGFLLGRFVAVTYGLVTAYSTAAVAMAVVAVAAWRPLRSAATPKEPATA